MESTASFGYWIRRQRKALDLTQQALADQVGCSLAAIKKIEQDERRPSRQIAERLAVVLDVPARQYETFLEVARGISPIDQLSLAQKPVVAALPTGIVTFLFTDIEDSTKRAQEHPEGWETLRARHHAILRETMEAHHGYVFQVIGDAFCAAFQTPNDGLRAAIEAQRKLQTENWGQVTVKVRMGIHTGEAEVHGNEYHGYLTLSLTERLKSAGHGGQILLSQATESLLRGRLPKDISLLDLGEYVFKNILQHVRVFQVLAPNLQKEFPALRAQEVLLNNLPVQLTSFIGREKEIADVIRLLDKARLVTLTGPGGTGKTRLSIQIANQLLDQYPDGVWLVELAPVSDPLLIPRTIAIAIGLRDEPHRPVIDMLLLCDYLHDKNLLLILDNCEHLIEACAQLADWLLHACPQIRILASSREALGMWGETLYLVPSLQLPELQNFPTAESMSQYEAVRLFNERASAATQHFTMTNENAFSIAQICQRLDGIPLAIELAAGKIRTLSVGQIAQRLDDRFHLLTGGSRTALPRHQTLQAAIEWSYNLLSPREQALFRRLSVFVNGWTLEAAESVCSDKDPTANETLKIEDILELLTLLVNKSLVMTEEGPREVRYHMLETIRQFGSAKLQEANETESLRDRHLEYCLQLAETAEPHLRGAEQIEWLKRLDHEHENLRAALVWAIDKPSAESALRLAGALGIFWEMRAYWLEGAKWLVQALNKEWDTNSKADKMARAKALYRRATIADNLDELDIAETAGESALALCQEVKDAWGTAYSRALVALHQGRSRMTEAIRNSFEQSLNEFQRLGDAWGESRALNWLGWVSLETTREEFLEITQRAIARARASGDRDRIGGALMIFATDLLDDNKWEEAESVLREAEQLFAEIDSSHGINWVHRLRARIFFAYGNLEKAKAEARLVIEHCVRVGDKDGCAFAFYHIALIAEAENDLQGAIENAQKGLELMREVGLQGYVAVGLNLVGLFKYQQGNVEFAMQYVRDSLEIVRRHVRGPWVRVFIFDYLGGLFVEKKTQSAVQLLALTESLSQSFAVPRDSLMDRPYFDRFLSAARAKLSEAEFTSAWEAGLKMTVDEALDLALKTVEEM